jgi:transposase
MRKLNVLNSGELRVRLREEVARSSHARWLHRMHCMLLIDKGFSCYQVAAWFGEDPKTLERWVHLWNEFGAERLQDRPHAGRRSRLTAKQTELLRLYLDCEPCVWGLPAAHWNGAVLRDLLRSRLEISLSLRQCQRLLPALINRSVPGVQS